MRILYFNVYGTHRGGVEGYIAETARLLEQSGHKSHLVYFAEHDSGDLLLESCTYVPFSEGGPASYSTLGDIERVIGEFKPDVAFVHAVYSAEVVNWIVRRLPVVAYVHGPYLACPGYALYLRRSKRACQRSAGVGCLLSAQQERCCFGRNPIKHFHRLREVWSLLQAYRSPSILVGSEFMKGLLCRNQIPAGHIAVLPPVLFSMSDEVYSPPQDPCTILFAGRVEPEKGLRLLLEVMARIKGDWRLLVVGDGTDMEASTSLAGQLGISGKVTFLGWCDRYRMEELYQQCGFVVVPSLWPEPFGRVGPEALRNGRPVVAFEIGGTSEWLEHGKSAYLVPPGDIQQLEESIEYLLAHPTVQAQMGQTAQAEAMVKWDAAKHMEQLLDHLARSIRGKE